MAINGDFWGKDKYEDMVKAGALKPSEDGNTDGIELVRGTGEDVVVKKLSKREKNSNVVTSVQDVINDTMRKGIIEQAINGMTSATNGGKVSESDYINDDYDKDTIEDDEQFDIVIDEDIEYEDTVENEEDYAECQTEYIDDDCDFIEEDDENTTSDCSDNTSDIDLFDGLKDNPFIDVPVNAGQLKSFSFNTMGMTMSGEPIKSMSTADIGVLDYLHKIGENIDKNTEGIIDMPESSLSTLLNAMVAIITNSAGILETLSNKLSEVDKKLSALYHACEFSSTFIDPQLKIDCFDEIHKLRTERREIKNKYNLISAVRDNSTNLCKKFKSSVLSAIDKVKNPEEFEPQYEVDLCKKLIDDLSIVDKFFEDEESA